jgi:hypothetical protein
MSPSFSTGVQRPGPRQTGTITTIVQSIGTVVLDNGSTVKFHPSAWRSGNTDDAIYRVGDRVEVLGGSPVEAVWRA